MPPPTKVALPAPKILPKAGPTRPAMPTGDTKIDEIVKRLVEIEKKLDFLMGSTEVIVNDAVERITTVIGQCT